MATVVGSLSVNGVELVKVRTCFGVFGSFFAALFDFFVVLVDILPFLFAPFCVSVVSKFHHSGGYLFP